MQDYSAYNRAPWYGSRASIKSVVIEPGVGNIGNRAFSDCTALTNVTIPDGINAIWDYAFSGCTSLSSVDIPQGTMIIGGSAFSGCTALVGGIIVSPERGDVGCADRGVIAVGASQMKTPSDFLLNFIPPLVFLPKIRYD